MAVKTKGVWGIDIGQCALKALRLEMIDGKPHRHRLRLRRAPQDPHPARRRPGRSSSARRWRSSSRATSVKGDDVAIGVAGQTGLARFVKLPPVEEKKIADIVKFEAKQQIPFPLDEVVWDYQKIGGGDGRSTASRMETEIGLFAMKRDMITRYLGHFKAVEDRGPHRPDGPAGAVQLRHLRPAQEGRPDAAAGEAAEADDDAPRGKKRCVVVLDIGTDASNLIITDGGEDHLAAADPARRQPLHPGPDQGTEAHLRQGRAPEAERHQEPGAGARSCRPSSRCSPTSSARCSGRSATSPTPTATPRSSTWSAWATPSGCPACRSSSAEKLVAGGPQAGQVRPAGRRRGARPTRCSRRTCSPSRSPTGWPCRGWGRRGCTTNLLPARDPHRAADPGQEAVGRRRRRHAARWAPAGWPGASAGPQVGHRQEASRGPSQAPRRAASAYGSRRASSTSGKTTVEGDAGEVKSSSPGQEERLNWPRFFEVQTAAMPRPGDPKKGGNLDATAAVEGVGERRGRGARVVQAADARRRADRGGPG